MSWLPLGNSIDSLKHQSQVLTVIYFSTETWGKLSAPHIVVGWEWFPVFYWRGKPTFHKQVKRSLPSALGMWKGLCVFCLKWNGPRDALTHKKDGFPCSGLNADSSFISQDEGMSASSAETLQKAIDLRLFWTGGLTLLWNLESCADFNASKGDDERLFVKIDRNPNITVPTNKDASPPTSLPEASCWPAKASLDFWGVRRNYTGVLTSLNKPEFQMAIPAVTREYTPGAGRNSRKHMRLPPRWKMRPNSPALHAVEFLVPNQTHKERQFPWWNSRKYPRTPSQDEKNTDVTSGMQNRLVYPKSTQIEAHFPCIGSIAIPRSKSYTKIWLDILLENADSLIHPSKV